MFLLQPPLLCRQIRVWWEKAECHARHDNKYFHRTYGNLFFAMSCAFSSPHVFHVWARVCMCVCVCNSCRMAATLATHKKKKYTQIQRTCLIAFMWRSCKYSERLFALLFCYLLVFGSKWHSFNALQPIPYVCLPKSRMLRNRQCRRKRLWLLATAFSYVSQIFFVLLTVFRIIGMILMWTTLWVFVVFRGCKFFFNGMAHLAKCLQV